ncbi:hypothetical protein [Chitinophaga arvensicola]|uniref:Uncharacterized protein n=1 Tax=Chitinophaga arvensicola TaxID=29529 RepID=A0A1I0SC31_9BACT|nr:hypothetical protein [Chitinophaga arvensicola]SEW54695.1 hypothetical protein SAMN04488122_6129 [Chitinophaga arvensicola]
MQALRKHLYYGIALLLILITAACRNKKNEVTPPGPDPVKAVYLVTAIRVNDIPKDSLVYNDKYQAIERWDYNTTYRKWQNYVTYTYSPDGYLAAAKYYNEIEYNVKSLTQKDSIVWNTGNLTIYTTNYRELGTAISGYDTVRQLINAQRQLIQEGSKDTVQLLDILGGLMVTYTEYTYKNNDLTGFLNMNYLTVRNTAPSLVISKYDITPTVLKNPLYPQVSKNPLLFRAILGSKFPDLVNEYYPYLVGEHLIAGVGVQIDNKPRISATPTFGWIDASANPLFQIMSQIDRNVTFSYKIIQTP